jgi:nucleotide-binding universal stress UspA family protein
MLRVHRILYPTDGSPCAEHAFGHASRLAALFGAELHAFHLRLLDVEAIPEWGAFEPPMTEEELTPGVLPEDVPVHRVIWTGDAVAEGILAYVEEAGIDLVVLGTHGRSGLGRLLMGSVAEEVVRQAGCPVLAVPQRAAAEAVERVLAPVDFSDHARRALAYARELAALHGAALDVLHVVHEPVVPAAFGPEVGALPLPGMLGPSREELEAFVAGVSGPEVPVELHSATGGAAAEIVRFAEGHGSGLIVLSTHGLTGLDRFLLGSVTEKVVRRAPCPVFTVRAFGRTLLADRDTPSPPPVS